jgi:hypothetical protein
MFIANQNFLSPNGMIRAGEQVVNPSAQQIAKGLVREIKVVELEVKNEPIRKQATKRTRKPRISE